MYLIGYDIGSSALKAALVDAQTRRVIYVASHPDIEMDIISRQSGWAEQQPELWWQHFCLLTRKLLHHTKINKEDIRAIGIGYQMHGLVLLDADHIPLRPSIIWCDSRAVPLGEQACRQLGESYCHEHLLNSPGNFTAAKLRWVQDNEPDIYQRIHKIMLPGDYIAFRLTGEINTTVSGLTEGIFWDFKENRVSAPLMDYFGFSSDLLPPVTPTFADQGRVSAEAAEASGLPVGVSVSYRAGDQPNNALALNVLHPGEVAATSGTSGVVYGIVDRPIYDKKSRVNAFAHVNHNEKKPRIGVLLCLNGAGIQYSWIKHQVARDHTTYLDMERMLNAVPIGSEGVCVLPFGNGAERMLENRNPNAHILNLQFNRHTRAHLYRAALEGVAFSFVYGINILKEMGLSVDVMRVGNDNMFQSPIFSSTIATLLGAEIEVVETTGAIGAAMAAGVGAGIYSSLETALDKIRPGIVYEPNLNLGQCNQAYNLWLTHLEHALTDPRAAGAAGTERGRHSIQKMREELSAKERELTGASARLASGETMLRQVRHDLNQLLKEKDIEKWRAALQSLARRIDKYEDDQSVWGRLDRHLELLHTPFIQKLQERYPDLSVAELKLSALLHQNLATKEIAEILHLSVRGVETQRYRLRRKLGLDENVNLRTFFMEI